MSDKEIAWKEYTFPSGTVYRGGFLGTRKEGQGFWRHPEGETYEGEYHNNKQHGWGSYTFPDSGKKYIGQWSQGEMHGIGYYTFNREGSEYYVGLYNHDKKHGKGVYRYAADCRVTEQMWNNGDLVSEVDIPPMQQLQSFQEKLEVKSKCDEVARNLAITPSDKVELDFIKKVEHKDYTFPSGAKYVGEFLGSKKHGKGSWSHPAGDTYNGQFRYNKHNGWGIYTIGKSGKQFVGGWSEGKMDGWGVYYFSEKANEYFIGTYRDDVKEGTGVYVFPSGTVKYQHWEKGELVDEQEATKEQTDIYERVRQSVHEIVGTFTSSP